MRWAYFVLALAGVLAVLWLAGEEHRSNCIAADRIDCSVLPWEQGDDPNPYDDLLEPAAKDGSGGAYEEVFGE